MITLFDLIAAILTLASALAGAGLAVRYGPLWAVPGAVAGGALGYYIGRLPTWLQIRRIRRKMAPLSADELRAELHSLKRFTPNFILMELQARGEDISPHVGYVLDLLESEAQFGRALGYGALLSAYPELAQQLKGYSPAHAREKCQTKVAELRSIAEQMFPQLRDTPSD